MNMKKKEFTADLFSREGFKELLNHVPMGIFRLTPGPQARFVYANSVFADMLGYAPDKIGTRQVKDVFADISKFRALRRAAGRQGRSPREELRIKTKKKKVLTCTLLLVAVKDAKKQIQYVDGIIENVSQQKRVEENLEESKELFKTVFNNSAAAITVADREEKIIAWNPFAEKMLQMGQKDLFNKPLRELYPPKEWRRMRAFNIRRKGMLADIETKVYKKDGSILDVNMSISVLKDTRGQVIGSIGILNDITKQKVAEKKIKESENKIRIILDNSAAGITLTDEQERIISWNRYAEHLLGFKKAELYLKPISSLYPQEEWQKIRAAEIRKAGSKHHLETKILHKSGKIIDIDLSVNVLKDSNNKIIGSVGILQDITEQKRFQQMLMQAKNAAEEANSSKSMFLANMSHEVRTPMNTIMGMVDLTLDTELTEEQLDNLMTIKDASDVLLSLLNDILDLSRVEAGKIHLEQIELNIKNIIKSVCKGLSVLARNKGLELQWDVDDDVPVTLLADPVRLRQVLVNLINNAIKFTFKGKITVAVKVEAIDEEMCQVRFSVSDEGVGIPTDKIKTIFDVFAQADVSTTRRFGGTGLGLAISKKLVEMMGGRLWVESEEFKGSTFHFTARLKIGRRDGLPPTDESIEEALIEALPKGHAGVRGVAPGAAGKGAEAAARDLSHLSILLAEDNIVNQRIAVRMLEKRGWSVKAADNGKQVLDYMDRESFDLILMDAQMPELDGFETTRLIRENEKKTGNHIPIIALTARAMSGDRKKCLDSGMDGYVAKPIDRKKLYEAIENLLLTA